MDSREPRTSAGRALLRRRESVELWHPIDGRRDEAVAEVLAIEAEAASLPSTDVPGLREALGELIAWFHAEVRSDVYECRSCTANVTRTDQHEPDCIVADAERALAAIPVVTEPGLERLRRIATAARSHVDDLDRYGSGNYADLRAILEGED